MQRIFWHWHPMNFTCFTYFLYSAPPCLNITCTKKSIGYIGIVWYRTMTLHQCLYRPANRKNAVITNIYCIFMNSDLYRYQCGIIRMDNGIVHSFPHSRLWERIRFNSCNIIIRYNCLHILKINQFYDTIRLHKQ